MTTPKFTLSNPDFNNTIYSRLEEKLGRKLSAEENERFFWTSGMYKEYFFNNLEGWTKEEAEYFFNNGRRRMTTVTADEPKFETPRSLLSRILDLFRNYE